MKKRWIELGLILGGLLTGICGIGAILIDTVLENPLIIRLGVRPVIAIQRIIKFGYVIGIALVVLLISICIIRYLIQRRSRQREQRRQNIERQQRMQAEAADLPSGIRKKFDQLSEKYGFCYLVNNVHYQLNQMDTMQARQNELLQANDAEYLQKTVNVVDEVERKICKNFQYLYNLCIVAGNWDRLDPEKRDKIFDDNEVKLGEVQKLLELSADLINKHNLGEGEGLSELESWIEVIQESLKEE